MVFGSAVAVQATIARLHHLNYAEPNDWSKPIATGQPNEVVVVLISACACSSWKRGLSCGQASANAVC